MRELYHHPFCPFSRKVRIHLAEKRLDFSLMQEEFWKKREDFLNLNPLGQVPILKDLNETIICDSLVICHYIEESYLHDPFLLPPDPTGKAETRRLMVWIDIKFAQDVSLPIVFERLFKRHFPHASSANVQALKYAKEKMKSHFEAFSILLDRRKWISGETLSLADITLAAHVSVIDYFGDIEWKAYPLIAEWYARMKSRPSMKLILGDRVPGRAPAQCYANLDF